MPSWRPAVARPHRPRPLSILYLRCWRSAPRPYRDAVLRELSILYLRCAALNLAIKCRLQLAFNSLLEMHWLDPNTCTSYRYVALSILYLRCGYERVLFGEGPVGV